MNNEKDLNYFKLLKDLKDCYEENVTRLEVPFPCLLDYPIDMPNRLVNLGFIVDLTNDSLKIELKQQNN